VTGGISARLGAPTGGGIAPDGAAREHLVDEALLDVVGDLPRVELLRFLARIAEAVTDVALKVRVVTELGTRGWVDGRRLETL